MSVVARSMASNRGGSEAGIRFEGLGRVIGPGELAEKEVVELGQGSIEDALAGLGGGQTSQYVEHAGEGARVLGPGGGGAGGFGEAGDAGTDVGDFVLELSGGVGGGEKPLLLGVQEGRVEAGGRRWDHGSEGRAGVHQIGGRDHVQLVC